MRSFIIYTKVLENTTVHIDLLFFSVDSSSRSLIVQLLKLVNSKKPGASMDLF